MNRIEEIEKRFKEIKAEIEVEGADIDALNKETDALIEERKTIKNNEEKRKAALQKIADNNEPIIIEKAEEPKMEERKVESRFKDTRSLKVDVKEVRNLLTTTSGVEEPQKLNGIVDNKNVASSIIEMVKVASCEGMGSNKVVYVSDDVDASDRTEGEAGTATEPTFKSVTIKPSQVGVVGYISNEVRFQSSLDYETKVKQNFSKSLKKKLSKMVVDAIYDDDSIGKRITSISAINDKTLRTIAMNYGGDDTVEGNAVLFLNKADLLAFGDVRGSNEKKAVYEITPNASNPNIGIIRDGGLSVPYCLCSQAKAFTGTTASSSDDTCTMFYGQPNAFELDIFRPFDVVADEHYKFAEDLITVKGTGTAGGAVVVPDGFLVVTIAKSAS